MGIAENDWTMKLAVFHTLFNAVGVLAMMPLISALVQFLEKHITVKAETTRDREVGLKPLYLNEAALLLPDTALEVLFKETENLFDNAFEIIAHGLNLHRTDILMGRSLDEIVAGNRESLGIDVIEKYHAGIKYLYGAIIEFNTRASANSKVTEDQQVSFYNLRVTCRKTVEIIKDLAYLRANLDLYIQSDNAHMRKEYNNIRKNIASILRRIFRIRDTRDQVQIFIVLKEMEEDVEAYDKLANHSLDRLLRGRMITPAMATSLMNDSAYAFDIGMKLIEIAKTMFIISGTDLKATDMEMLLQVEDLQPTQ